MSDYPGLNKIFLLAVGVYMFTAMIQAETSQARVEGVLERAIHHLGRLDLSKSQEDGAGHDPTFAYLEAFQP